MLIIGLMNMVDACQRYLCPSVISLTIIAFNLDYVSLNIIVFNHISKSFVIVIVIVYP